MCISLEHSCGTPAGRFLRLAAGSAFFVAIALLVPGCSPSAPSTPSALSPAESTDCTGATLTPGPCDEPWSTGPDPVLPENRCPTAAEVAQIQEEVPVTVQSDATAGTLACRAAEGSVDLTPAQASMFRGLLFMRRVRFDAPLPWTTQTLYDWLRGSIPAGVVVIATGNSYSCYSCPGPVYIAWRPGPRAVGVDVLSAASILVHEARHTNNIRHTCKPVAPYGNTLDRTIAELGAMSVDYYLRLWIAIHTDEHPDTREYARRQAALLRPSFCCECGPRAAAVALTNWLTLLLPRPGNRPASPCGGAPL